MEGVKIVNLTPHPITIYDKNGEKVLMEIPPSGQVVRVKPLQKQVGEVNGVPIMKTEWGPVEGLPDPEPGKIYIVSTLVLQALKDQGVERSDLIAPDTSPASAVRDENGRIVGVKRFQVL